MRILVVSPSAPRFDATVHYWQTEFSACVSYLRRRFPSAAVVAEPAGLICAPMRVIVGHLLDQPHFVVLWARVWESPTAREIGILCREIAPQARVLVWGDGPLFMPHYFAREPIRRGGGGRRCGVGASRRHRPAARG